MPEAGAALARASDLCRQRPCSGYELHAAGVLAGDPGQAWLRLWVQALVLAFLTGRPLPCLYRLSPCPCGSGRRYRDCCLKKRSSAPPRSRAPL